MAATETQLYQAHVKNLRAVDTALNCIFRELNASLCRADDNTPDALLKTTMLLLGGWAENRLKKLLFEPNGFSQQERERIELAQSQFESWKLALEIGFRKRYAIPNANLATSLLITPRGYFQTLTSALDEDLKPIIEIRNKLAHGQWARTLNSENTDFSNAMMAKINAENALTIKFKKRLLENLARLIHDLVAGNHAFNRDFDEHYRNLESARNDIANRSYNDWLLNMKQKFERGKQARRQ